MSKYCIKISLSQPFWWRQTNTTKENSQFRDFKLRNFHGNGRTNRKSQHRYSIISKNCTKKMSITTYMNPIALDKKLPTSVVGIHREKEDLSFDLRSEEIYTDFKGRFSDFSGILKSLCLIRLKVFSQIYIRTYTYKIYSLLKTGTNRSQP